MVRVPKTLPVIIFIFFLNSILLANNTLKGRVMSPAGLPVSQAEVTLINLGQSVLTDDQGQFSLEVPSPEKKLKFRIKHPDYFEQEFQVNRPPVGQAISFVLTPFIPQREEVVVTATRFPEPLTSVPAASSVVRLADNRGKAARPHHRYCPGSHRGGQPGLGWFFHSALHPWPGPEEDSPAGGRSQAVQRPANRSQRFLSQPRRPGQD